MLYRKGEQWAIAGTAEPPSGEQAEARRRAAEAGRHGAARRAAGARGSRCTTRCGASSAISSTTRAITASISPRPQKKYDAVPRRRSPSRDDLNYLFEEMLGELTVGHMFIGGGDAPEPKKVKGGLLGRRLRASRTAATASRRSTAARTGTRVCRRRSRSRASTSRRASTCSPSTAGSCAASDDVYAFFEETAGRQVRRSRSARTRTAAARARSPSCRSRAKQSLRNLAWIEGNRRKVDELTGGRVAYVYLPDTAGGGYTQLQPLLLRPGRQAGARSSTSGSTAAG